MYKPILAGLAAFALSGCASTLMDMTGTRPAADDPYAAMLRGEGAMQGKQLEAAIEKAAQHPLGSMKNPVRAHMPGGQRAYLSRLRCSDGNSPTFQRIGNMGVGPYGNFVDAYGVECGSGTPADAVVHLDMYHPGHKESRTVGEFTIAD